MSWMKSLSNHYHLMRKKFPDSQLMIVFDIDDTIVDIRIPLLFVLQKYDSQFRTSYFQDLTLRDIVFEEWHIQDWLPEIVFDESERKQIVEFVRSEMWQEETILLSHRPFRGVLEIIRWFHNKCYIVNDIKPKNIRIAGMIKTVKTVESARPPSTTLPSPR